MAKIKKSIWSMALGVVLCLTLVVGIIAGNSSYRLARADETVVDQYTSIMAVLVKDYITYDTKTNILTDETIVSVKGVGEDTHLNLYFQAQNLYNNSIEGTSDVSNPIVESSKGQFDLIKKEVFDAPHNVADEITKLGDILARGVVYSDKAEYERVNDLYNSLDENQKTYVGTLPNFENLAELKKELDRIRVDIDRVIGEINNEETGLGKIAKEGYSPVYSDVDIYESVIADYNTLDDAAKEVVKEESNYANVAESERKINELLSNLNRIIKEINDFELMINREFDATTGRINGVIYSDHIQFDKTVADYDELEASSQAYVRDNSNYSNRRIVNEAIIAIRARIDEAILAITSLHDNTLDGVVLADEAELNSVKSLLVELNKYDASARDFVENGDVDTNNKPGCEVFDCIEYVETEIANIKARLDKIVNKVNVDIKEVLDRTVVITDEALYAEVKSDLENKELVRDVDESNYINDRTNNLENYDTLRVELDKIYARLDEVVKAVNGLEEKIGNVTLADEDAIVAVRNQVLDVTDLDEQEYVNKNTENLASLVATEDELQKIKDRLQVVIDAVNGLKAKEDIRLADRADIEGVRAKVDAVTDELEKAYVAERTQDLKPLKDAEEALKAILERLDDLSDRINALKDLENNVKLAHEAMIVGLRNEVTALDDADETKYVEDHTENLKPLEMAEAEIQAIKDELDKLIYKIDVTIQERLDAGVVPEDETLYDDVVTDVRVLDAEETAYVHDNAKDYANIQELRDALDALKGKLERIIDLINKDLQYMIDDGVKLGDEPRFNEINDQINELNPEELKYVQDNSKFENVKTVEDAIQDIKDRLDAIIDDVNALDELKGKVTLADEKDIDAVRDEVDAVTDPDEIKYVNDGTNNLAPLTNAEKEIEDIYARLQKVIDAVNALKEKEGQFTLADEANVKDVKDQVNNVTDELEKAHVNKETNNLAPLTNAEAEIKAIYDRLDEIAEEVNALKEKEGKVTLADEDTIKDVRTDVDAVEGDLENTYLNGKTNDLAPLTNAEAEIKAIYDRLDKIAKEVNDLDSLIGKVTLADEDTIKDVRTDVDAVEGDLENAYLNGKTNDLEKLLAVEDELKDLYARLDEIIDHVNNELKAMLDKPVELSDETRFNEIKAEVEALPEKELAYVDSKTNNHENVGLVEAELNKIKAEMQRIINEINNLDLVIANGVRYSNNENYKNLVEDYNKLDKAAREYVEANSHFANIETVGTALAEIEDRVSKTKEVINNIMYRLNNAMVANSNGEIVYDSQVSVDAATLALNAIYNGTESIANLPYKWDEVEVNALVDAGLIDNLDKYDAAVAILEAYKAAADKVADRINGLTFTAENNYKTQETLINEIYNEYVALDLGLFNNTQNYIDSSVRSRIETLKAYLNDMNAWILKVATLVNSEVTAENADEVISNTLATGVNEYITFNIDTVNALLDEYTTLVGEDEIAVASLREAYEVLKAIKTRIEDLNRELADKIIDILDRNPELKEDDFYTIQDVKEIYDQLDQTQKDYLEETISPYTFEEFEDLANKFLFYLYFKSAVDELSRQVEEGYFTVEGYVLEKALLSMYHNFDYTMKSMVESCYDKLLVIDNLYREADMLDYNKVKEELEKADAALREELLAADTALREELKNGYEQADEALKEALEAADAALEEAMKAADAALEEAMKTADTALKEALEKAYAEADTALKEALEEAMKVADNALKTELEEAMKAADETLKNALEAANAELKANLESDMDSLKSSLETEVSDMKSNIADLEKQIADMKAELEAADKANQENIDSLKKTVKTLAIIGAIVLAVLAVCVVVLFVKSGKASKSNNSSNKSTK